MRSIVFWGLYWDPPILGNYQVLYILDRIQNQMETGNM